MCLLFIQREILAQVFTVGSNLVEYYIIHKDMFIL